MCEVTEVLRTLYNSKLNQSFLSISKSAFGMYCIINGLQMALKSSPCGRAGWTLVLLAYRWPDE